MDYESYRSIILVFLSTIYSKVIPMTRIYFERTYIMSNPLSETKLGKLLGPKGLCITLGTCLVALAGAGVTAYKQTIEELNNSVIIDEPSPVRQADNKTDGVLKNSMPDSSPSSATDSSSKTESIRETAPKPSETVKTQPNVMPVHGDIIRPFSNGELVKDETLGVWRTHDGVDIKADVGTPVKAMNKGTVTEVKNDPLMGYTVIIDHGNGITAWYQSLSKAVDVTEGDSVNSGQTIGTVGDTAESEAAERSHLHFAVKKNGSWVDPLALIGGTK